MEPNAGFVPFDFTHPAEWLNALAWLTASAWTWLVAFGAIGLVLAALLWATRQRPEAGALGLDEAVALYARWLKALPTLALAGFVLAIAFGVGSGLASRTHHREQTARANQLAGFPEGKMVQSAPTFGHQSDEAYVVVEQVGGKPVSVTRHRTLTFTHRLSGSELLVDVLKRPDPVHPGWDRFGVRFAGRYRVANPTRVAQPFFIDLPGPEAAGLVADLKVEHKGKVLSPTEDGGVRYRFDLGEGESSEVAYSYNVEGIPRWVYDTRGERLSAFKLTLRTDVPKVAFASGIAPGTDASVEGKRELVWDYPSNATLSEPVGLFTAAGKLEPAGYGPRWFLLSPGLLALWLVVLALVAPLRPRSVVLAGLLFGGAVVVAYALSAGFPMPLAWALPALLVAAAAGHLVPGAEGLRSGTVVALVLPGAALGTTHAAMWLAAAAVAAGLWMVVQLTPPSDTSKVAAPPKPPAGPPAPEAASLPLA